MKRIIIYAVLVLLFSCKGETKNFVVEGLVKNNPEKQTLYLDIIELDAPAPRILDTIDIEKGNASFSLSVPDAENESIYRLRFSKDNKFVILIGDDAKVKCDFDWNKLENYTTNSPASNSFHSMFTTYNSLQQEFDSLRIAAKSITLNDSTKNIADAKLGEKGKELETYLLRYADTTANPSIALFILGPILNDVEVNPAIWDPVYIGLSKRFSDNPVIQKIVGEYFEKAQEKMARGLVGVTAPEITLPDVNGNSFTLSSLRGKYVLVDFWASWCGPCRQENPNVVAAYNKFKSKNFTILGVSLDQSKDAWTNAIKNDGLTWTHISDLKYWQSTVVPLYNITGIPYNVLIDPQGKIIADNLRGTDLEQKLSEVLK